MGILTQMSHDEIGATLQVLEAQGVRPEHWREVRKKPSGNRSSVVGAFLGKSEPTVAENGGISLVRPNIPDPSRLRQEMEAFYEEVYPAYRVGCLRRDLSAVRIPESREGFCWGLIMFPGLTVEADLAAMQKEFPVWRQTNDNLDRLVESVRTTDGEPYAIWFRDRVEADEEFENLSAEHLAGHLAVGIITLPERVRLERWFHWRTGGRLDLKNWTLCSGSRRSGGSVPFVGWNNDGLGVRWCCPQYAGSNLRARAVVAS